eukprot:TRINITY_DN1939_c0_g1_i1.p1 TRINITY_DN1939_c0_g1~~TRINITY_DN1939_c0_g1_i1.p1  ORF type:complete len:607 (+),score=96.96 TRINITY_DN1939_c0_g1_i1:50-1870(+)
MGNCASQPTKSPAEQPRRGSRAAAPVKADAHHHHSQSAQKKQSGASKEVSKQIDGVSHEPVDKQIKALGKMESDTEKEIKKLLEQIRSKTFAEGNAIDKSTKLPEEVKNKPTEAAARLQRAATAAGVNKNVKSKMSIKIGEVDLPRTSIKATSQYSADQEAEFQAVLKKKFPHATGLSLGVVSCFIEYAPDVHDDKKALKRLKSSIKELLSKQNKLVELRIMRQLGLMLQFEVDYTEEGLELTVLLTANSSLIPTRPRPPRRENYDEFDDSLSEEEVERTPERGLIETILGKPLYEGDHDRLSAEAQSTVEFNVNLGDFMKDSYLKQVPLLTILNSGFSLKGEGEVSPSLLGSAHSQISAILQRRRRYNYGRSSLVSKFGKYGERACSVEGVSNSIELRNVDRILAMLAERFEKSARSHLKKSDMKLDTKRKAEFEDEITLCKRAIESQFLTEKVIAMTLSGALVRVTRKLRLKMGEDGTLDDPTPSERYVRDIVFGLACLGDIRSLRLWSPVQKFTLDAVGLSPFKMLPRDDSEFATRVKNAELQIQAKLMDQYQYPILRELYDKIKKEDDKDSSMFKLFMKDYADKVYIEEEDDFDEDVFNQFV